MAALGIVALLSIPLGAFALQINSGNVTPIIPSQCAAQPLTWSPQPIINSKMTVQNDEDAGNVGYWALDNYPKSIVIWEDSTNTNFCALIQYSGTWQTFAGALSPQNGVAEVNTRSGHFTAAYVAMFTGTFFPTVPVHGSIGTYNFGGTMADILLGSYGNGQTGDTTYTSYLSLYFSSHAGFTYLAASYIYTLGAGMGYGKLWVSSPISTSADMGDILT